MRRLLFLVPWLAACAAGPHDSTLVPSSLERGAALYEEGEFAAALVHYDRAVAEEPDSSHAHDLRGEALMELGRLEEALAALGRAVELDPENAFAHSHRGQVLLALGMSDQAAAEFERALRLEPDREHFRRNLERARGR